LEQCERSLRFEPLNPKHNRAEFSCGVLHLDNYIRTQAGQDTKKNLAAVFVLTPDGSTIAGYYTLSQFSVELDEIPDMIAKKLTRLSDIPATLIGRLARSRNFYGKGVGELLLMDALHRALVNSKEIASWAVIVDAKDDNASRFYAQYGFISLPKILNRLFLPMGTIAKMF
jgi:predicted GNAT family N-acyltransferase